MSLPRQRRRRESDTSVRACSHHVLITVEPARPRFGPRRHPTRGDGHLHRMDPRRHGRPRRARRGRQPPGLRRPAPPPLRAHPDAGAGRGAGARVRAGVGVPAVPQPPVPPRLAAVGRTVVAGGGVDRRCRAAAPGAGGRAGGSAAARLARPPRRPRRPVAAASPRRPPRSAPVVPERQICRDRTARDDQRLPEVPGSGPTARRAASTTRSA